MKTSAARLATGAVALSFVALGATPALAVCDPYSEQCVNPQSQETDASTQSQTQTQTQTQSGSAGVDAQVSPSSTGTGTPSTLPFTGGEVVLIAVLGAAAVGGGVVLAVAGRRRGTSVA